MIDIKLIKQERCSSREVIKEILDQKEGTSWSKESSQWSIDYVNHLTEVYGESWYKGFLSQEDLLNILLPEHPKHRHALMKENKEILIALDTSVLDAVKIYKNRSNDWDKECSDNIEHLKNEIETNGFKSTLTLAVINNTLKHVDGLHRLLAMGTLIDEEYSYTPIPVFLCDNTK